MRPTEPLSRAVLGTASALAAALGVAVFEFIAVVERGAREQLVDLTLYRDALASLFALALLRSLIHI